MLSSPKLSIFVATVSALAVLVSSSVYVSDFCQQVETVDPCQMQAVLKVSFGECGARVAISDASAIPNVYFNAAQADKEYLLVMVDPDAPSPRDHKYQYWRHWVVAGIPGSNLKYGSTQGNTLSGYTGPSPPPQSGPHRYQLFLFGYTKRLPFDNILNDKYRRTWDVAAFIEKNGLCRSVVAGFQFTSENDYQPV